MSRFRLAGLLRLRKMQEDTAAAELARRSMHRRESERLESKALAAIGEHRLEASGSAESWIASVAARSAYSASVDMARAAVGEAIEAETAAQLVYRAAKQKATTLDKLESRHIEAERAEEERVEQQVLDELATQRAFRGEAT